MAQGGWRAEVHAVGALATFGARWGTWRGRAHRRYGSRERGLPRARGAGLLGAARAYSWELSAPQTLGVGGRAIAVVLHGAAL